MWGYGSSPVIHGNRVYQYCGPGRQIFVTALDLATGEMVWKIEEPQEGDGEYNTNKKYMGSWTTPIIANVNGQDQLIVTLPTRVVAYHPTNGKILWYCEGIRGEKGDLAYSSPLVSGDILVQTGGFNGPALALRLGGTGDITESHRLWRMEPNPQNIGSGVFLGDVVYRPNAGPGTIECIEARSGKVLWTSRGAGGNIWGSMVYAAGLILVTNQEGTTILFKPNRDEFEPVAENALGEPCNSTPAISNGEIFLRTADHLYCIS
jgi:outer membrane protein assembly factor BamB